MGSPRHIEITDAARPTRRVALRVAAALIAPLGWPGLAPAQAPSADAASLTLGIAVYDGAPSPFSEVFRETLLEAGRRAGIRIAFKPLPLPRVLEMANAAEVDGDPIRIAGVVDQYPNLVQVPTPVAYTTLLAYALTPEIARRTRSELHGARACKMRGAFNAVKYTAGMATTDARTNTQMLEMMRTNRCEILVAEYADFETLLKARPQADVYRWPHAWASEPLYTLLHRRHAALVPRLDAALQSMKRDGRMERLVTDIYRAHGIAPPPEVEAGAPR